MTTNLMHKGLTPRIWSPNIWGNVPIERWALGVGGYLAYDDFRNHAQHNSDQSTQKYDSYIDTGVTIQSLQTEEFGAAEVAGNDADNDEGSLQAHGVEAKIDSDDLSIVCFEARFKKASIADNALALFLGLMEPGKAAAEALTDNDGAMPDFDHIGFHVDHAAGEQLDFVFTKAGQSDTVVLSGAHTLVADTYVNVGFIIDPRFPPSKRGQIVIDNVIQTTYLTQTQIEADGFPDDEPLARMLATKVGAASESKLQLDWWALGIGDG